MPKAKKKISIKVHDQKPAKDPKGGGHKHSSHHHKGEQAGPVDPSGFPTHPVQ